jgi:hypothetical protein
MSMTNPSFIRSYVQQTKQTLHQAGSLARDVLHFRFGGAALFFLAAWPVVLTEGILYATGWRAGVVEMDVLLPMVLNLVVFSIAHTVITYPMHEALVECGYLEDDDYLFKMLLGVNPDGDVGDSGTEPSE